MKKKRKTLGNPAAVAVASELLKDKDIRQGAVNTVKTGTKILKYVWIGVGSLVGVAVLIWGGKKIIKSIKEAKQDKKAADHYKEKSKNKTYDDSWYADAVKKLKSAMHYEDGKFNSWFTSYNKDEILTVLKALQVADDWYALSAEFGRDKDGHNLAQWIGCDGRYDIADYNKELERIKVDKEDIIVSQDVFGVVEDRIL